MKPLHIPQNKKWKSLKIYCYNCKTNVDRICKETGKALTGCPNGDRHKFKIYAHVPGTKNERKTKTLDTRDIDEAIRQTMEFQKEIKENLKGEKDSPQMISPELRSQPTLLVHAIARYLAWLNNENVPEHLKVERSMEHIKDIERVMHRFIECLHKNDIDVKKFKVTGINDHIVGKMHEFMLKDKEYENRTYNKYFTNLKAFLKWYQMEYNIAIPNWFAKVKKEPENPQPKGISKSVFDAILNQIKPENGIQEYAHGKKRKRDFYTDYLNPAIKWGAYTGLRREELCKLKFSDIREEDGFSYFLVENLKVNRMQKRKSESVKKYITVPISPSLQELLNEARYDKYKGTDHFILAPEKIDRKSMPDRLSRGFAHFYKQIEPNGDLTFRSLRKTYITGLAIYTGGNAASITQHGDNQVLERHYIDKNAIAKAAKNFEPFSAELERKGQLDKVRRDSQAPNKQNEREVGE